MILCHTWIFWSHWCWMNYTSLWEMRLGHFCLLWAIYVFYFFFLDILSLVTPLSLLISFSFLKPLSIVFQDGIWSVCFNVVVCERIQRSKKTKEKKIKKKEKEKERKSVRKKKIKRVLIKFWKVKWKDRILLWKEEEVKKKKCWMEIPKRVDILTNLENTSYYLPLPIFILFPLLLPYITS